MKNFKPTLAGIALSLLLTRCSAQTAQPDELEAIESQLKNGAGVSAILTDPKHQSLRPENDFRLLIKKYADTAAVDISPEAEPGKRIRIIVTLTDEKGLPLADRLVYFYQTDTRGWYSSDSPHVGGNAGDMRQARLFGYVRTNASGEMTIYTIKPNGYPQSEFPGHIHFHVDRPGGREFVTELLFDDDERLVGNTRDQSVRAGFQIAKPEAAPTGFDQQFSYRIRVN